MNEVALRAGQHTFDASGGKLGQGALSPGMSRISLEAVRSIRDVVQEDLARKVGGGNPDDFDLLCHTAKRSLTRYANRLAVHTAVAWLSQGRPATCPFILACITRLAPIPFALPLLWSLSASYAKQMIDLYTLARPSLELISV
jgi:hypothetical protein